jgi:glycyl-tRNA synthetase
VTPSVVLEASGHVERFTDFMVQDAVTKDCHRADHLLEDALETALRDAAKTGLTPELVQVGSRSTSVSCIRPSRLTMHLARRPLESLQSWPTSQSCRPLAMCFYHCEQEARTTLATVGELDQAQLGTALKAWAVKAPETGNDITEPQPFKLMFQVPRPLRDVAS